MAKKNEVRDTGFPGIKQRISDNKYVVTLDYGRQKKTDPKTGEVRLRQVKTTRVVSTLKEAKALLGENSAEKRRKKVTASTGKIPFNKSISEYIDYYSNEWSTSHRERQGSYMRRLNAYFGDEDVRDIDTGRIEDFFKWCRVKNAVYDAISNNTIEKIKSMLNHFFKWMKKNYNTYDIHQNPVPDAEVGKKERFVPTELTIEDMNDILRIMLDHEKDYSIFAIVGLASLAGMRRGEILGLKWKHVHWDDNRIYIEKQRSQKKKGNDNQCWEWKTPKNGNDEGKSPEERRERWTAMPKPLSIMLKYVRDQQEKYLGRKVKGDDLVYMTKVNLVDHYPPVPSKADRRVNEFQVRCNKVRKAQEKGEFQLYRLHDLRHWFISTCINNGVPLTQVMASAGHAFSASQNGTSLGVYWHDDGNRKEIVKCIDKVIKTKITVPDMEISSIKQEPVRNRRKDKRSDEL